MKKNNVSADYMAPVVEKVEVAIERGFAASDEPNGFFIDDAEYDDPF